MSRYHNKSLLRKKAVKAGFRSGLELNGANILKKHKIKFEYESIKLPYRTKTSKRNHCCGVCGSKDIMVETAYTPDFIFGKLIYEFKGEWKLNDRKKILAVIEQNPDYEIVMIFQEPKIKTSKNFNYGSWCTKMGIKWFAFSDANKWIEYIKTK